MIKIDVHNIIENRTQAFFFYGSKEYFFGLDDLREILESNPNDNEITLNIHCSGGSVSEGLAIYDYLRTSGKTIYANIEGDCHSMAIVLLLAAPPENRTCQKNASALIHKVTQFVVDDLTGDQATKIADEIKTLQEKILYIYADRTGNNIDFLRNAMDEEKTRDANFLLTHNFVSRINDYNTNLKKQNMMKQTLLQRAKNFLEGKGASKNFVFTDEEDNKLFETSIKEDALEIGMEATPDGIFTLAKDTSTLKAGSVITVEDGKIVEIIPYEDDEVKKLQEETGENITNIKTLKRLRDLINENKELNEKINQARDLISDFMIDERQPFNKITSPDNVITRLKQNRNK